MTLRVVRVEAEVHGATLLGDVLDAVESLMRLLPLPGEGHFTHIDLDLPTQLTADAVTHVDISVTDASGR